MVGAGEQERACDLDKEEGSPGRSSPPSLPPPSLPPCDTNRDDRRFGDEYGCQGCRDGGFSPRPGRLARATTVQQPCREERDWPGIPAPPVTLFPRTLLLAEGTSTQSIFPLCQGITLAPVRRLFCLVIKINCPCTLCVVCSSGDFQRGTEVCLVSCQACRGQPSCLRAGVLPVLKCKPGDTLRELRPENTLCSLLSAPEFSNTSGPWFLL